MATAKAGARVLATDINPDAVRNARLNAAKHHLDLCVRYGNLFEPIARDEQFDFIFWAHPFNNWPYPVHDALWKSGRDYHYVALKGYLAGARKHLTPNGRLLLGTGDSADIETISSSARANGYHVHVLHSGESPLEENGDLFVKYLLCEFLSD